MCSKLCTFWEIPRIEFDYLAVRDLEIAAQQVFDVLHPGVELRADLKSMSHRCHLFEVAFVWELTKEAIHLPLGLHGGKRNPDI